MRFTGRRLLTRVLIAGGMALLGYPLASDLTSRHGSATIALAAPQAQGGGSGVLNAPDHPALRGFRFREIGPTGQGGRIDDFAVNEANPYQYFVGFATAGVWRTMNNGTTYDPIFQSYGVGSIGDLALAPSNPNILYVGTGEANFRQSTSFGNGVWKTTNALAEDPDDIRFEHVGLRDTLAIGRMIVHPKNPDIVWVAAAGHLYGPNPDRGVFMTTDGGKTWNKTLYLGENVGATDMIIDPTNPNTLWATTYEYRRTSWGFVGGGPGSGIHQSTDGGKTWRRLSGGGLPRGTMGRNALDICRSNPNVIYAQIEAAPDKETGEDLNRFLAAQKAAQDAAAAQAGRGGGGGGGGRGGGGRGGGVSIPDPQSNGVFRSTDKGKTWTFMSNENQRPMYFSQIRCDPNNPETIYVGGVNPRKSNDGGKTWINLQGMGHVDNHAIWINPMSGVKGEDSKHVMYGNDGGIDVSYDAGRRWESIRMWGVAYSYHVSADMRRPYWICTGLQDNGSWCGPSSTRSGGIHMWNWISVGGGDGFQTQVDPTDPNIFYTESQNGNINRYDLNTGQTQNVRPQVPQPGGRQGGGGGGGGGGRGGGGRGNVINPPTEPTISQFNWNSPIRISPHNPSTILFGGRQLFISRDRGASWVMSTSLGKNIDLNQRTILEQQYSLPGCGRGGERGKPCILSKHDGYVNNEYGSLTEISESPVIPGVIWTGTDDGNVQVTRDGGLTFTEVGKNMPHPNKEYYVSGLEASWHDAGTAYASVDGHRHDDHRPYIFKTTNYGQSWTSVSGNLPAFGHVNSIRQDPVNPNLLYAATEYGFYISLNDGGEWHAFMPNLPHVRVDEVLVHPRDNDLIIATHARGIWIMDDITALQNLTPEMMKETSPTLFKPRDAVQWRPDRRNNTEVPGDKWWQGETAPAGTAIAYWLPSAANNVLVTITNTATGQAVRTCTGTGDQGMNRFQWTLSGNPGGGGGGGFGGRGGGRGAQAEEPPAQTGPTPCAAGGGGGGRGGGGRGGFGGGGIGPGVYRVTLSVGGKEVGAQTFSILEDIWLNDK